MNAEPAGSPQEIVDAEHLRRLAIFYYVVGGMYVCFSSLAILYIVFGLVIASDPGLFHNPDRPGDPGIPAAFGYLAAAFGAIFLLVGWTFGGLTIYAGRSIQQRRNKGLTLVIAALNCVWIPFGTILGIFTFIVLLRPSVERLYDAQA